MANLICTSAELIETSYRRLDAQAPGSRWRRAELCLIHVGSMIGDTLSSWTPRRAHADDIIERLKGDALGGTLDRYGKGRTEVEILAEHLANMKVKGLDLSHLRVR